MLGEDYTYFVCTATELGAEVRIFVVDWLVEPSPMVVAVPLSESSVSYTGARQSS